MSDVKEKTTEAVSARPKIDYAALKQILVQNPARSRTKTFVQYTKEQLKTYIRNPFSNIDNLRAISAFLARNSMIYKKILAYFSQMPLFYYDLIYRSDYQKGIDYNKFIKKMMDVSKRLQEINMRKEFSTVIATALRDGIYYGFVYDGDGDGFFLHGLDPQYCKITAITEDGEYIIAFNASYFDQGNNSEYINGVNDDGEGVWDQVFIDGYNTYKNDGRDFMWFELPPEKTLCLPADEDAEMPLPYFLPVFVSLLDLLDLEQILASKTELENYVLLLSKIPLIPNTDEVDDFAVSLELVQYIQSLIDDVVPELVGTAYSPCDLEVINFNKANNPEDTDKLSVSMNNLFSNLGISKLVVSPGSSTNAVGLKHSIQNDESFALKYVDRLQTWMNSYIKANYSNEFIFKFHRLTYFSQEDVLQQYKDAATLGAPVALSLPTILGQTPYEMFCSLLMEQTLGVREGLFKPLQTSYTQSGNVSDEGGRPEIDEGDLSDEGLDTRAAGKNETTKANK